MKKVLTVVLCLAIIISSFATVLFQGALANANINDFNDSSKWVRYAFNTTHINSANGTIPDRGSLTTNTNTAYTYNGDASSIKISAKLQISTIEFETKPNTNYELTYRFLTSGAKYNSVYLVRTGIVVPNGSVTWGADGYVLYIDSEKSYTAPNGVFANRTSIINRTTEWVAEGVWHQVTLNFNSGNNETLKLVVQAGTDEFYVDDFGFSEVADFENVENWAIYRPTAHNEDSTYIPTPTFDRSNTQRKMSWCSVTNDMVDADSTGKSIKINGNAFNVASKLPTLKTNTKYTLSFKYKPSSNTTVAGSNGAYFTSHIIKDGTAFDSYGYNPKEFVADLGKGTETTDWKEISVSFITDSTTDYMLEFRFAFSGGYVLYLDAFTLEEAPKPTYLIQDFENYASGSALDGLVSVVTPEGTSLSGAKAIQYDGSVASSEQIQEGNNRFIINPVNSGLPMLSNIVSKGSKFKLTFKYKLLSGEVKFYLNSSTNGTSCWSHASPNPIDFKSSTLAAGDGWQEFSYEYTIKSTATDGSYNYPLILIGGNGKAYIDYLTISTLNAEVPDVEIPSEPEPEPEPIDPSDYDNAANWKLYHANYAPVINGSGPNKNDWIENSQNTNKAYTYNDGEKSIKIKGNIQFVAIKLANLTEGKNYKVKFMYYAPTTSTVGTSSRAWVDQLGVIKGGTTMNANMPNEYLKKGTTFAGEAGEWHEHTLSFKAETTDLYFGMLFTFVGGYEIYLDDFTVTEVESEPEPDPEPEPPVVSGKEPQKQVIIDFDNYGGNATLSLKDRIEIVEAKAYDGKPSKMLHFIKGQYSSATTLNYGTTYETDTDSVFTVGVKPQKVYNVSFRVKTDPQTLPQDAKSEWVGIYFTFGKQNLISSYQHSAKRGEWLYYEYSLSTSATQNLLSFYVNAGESTPDLWIDDIAITETEFEPFSGWGEEPRDEILINFDDFYVNYDIACASIVDGPERDGKITKATYLKGGSYSYNVVANYGLVTKYKDPVFTVPCKENTLYEFSYYIYVPKNTGNLGYFAVYYDWENTWVLRSSAMPERDQWVKKTIRFTTKKGQTKLSITFNGGQVIPDIYLDDILLKELKPGVVNYANDASYCEDCFNILPSNGAVEKITNSKTTVVKIPVLNQQQYILGVTVSSRQKSKSRIFLSFDGVNPMQGSDPNAPSAIISSDGNFGRYGINFISNTSGYVYLVIENDDGALTLSDPYLFLANSISTNLPMGRAEKPITGILSVNVNKGYFKKLFVFDDEEGGESAE